MARHTENSKNGQKQPLVDALTGRAFYKMIKFCAFYKFFALFFHLNFCTGHLYRVKYYKKITVKKRIILSF
jgi:hypothetical protein